MYAHECPEVNITNCAEARTPKADVSRNGDTVHANAAAEAGMRRGGQLQA